MMLEKVQKAAFTPLYLNPHQNRQNMAESRGGGEKMPQDCWQLMTRAEKVLLLLLVLALLVLLALSAFVINHFLNEKNCDTHECIEASYKLLKTIDFNSNPCTDYDNFVCGNYIPAREEEIFNLDSEDFEDDRDLQTVKKFYQACTNESAIEEDNEETLSALISHLGGWPLFKGKEWDEDNFNWLRYMADVRHLGVKSDWLLSFDYYEEDGTNLLLITPPKLNASSFEFKTAYYQEVIAQLATKLGSSEAVDGQVKQMINFEISLYNISTSARNEILEKPNYTKRTVSQLNISWPDNLLSDVLNALARGYSVFTNSTVVAVAPESYLYFLHKLLTGVPKRTQANYLVWKTVEIFLPYCSDDIREVYAKYVDIGTREEHCHSETIRRFHSIIEMKNIRKYKSGKTLPLLYSIANLTYQSYNKSEDACVSVVVEGPRGENSGVTDIVLNSSKIIRMINEIQFHVENQFYNCLQKQGDCVKEGYYEVANKLEPYFDTTDGSIHLPYSLVYSDSFMWNQPNYINFAKIGRIIGDTILEAEEERYNTTINKCGVNMAYEAYIKWVQSEGMEKKLPVFNYTVKQLFWIHSSSMYCSSEDDSDKFEEVAQSQYFKKDFECP